MTISTADVTFAPPPPNRRFNWDAKSRERLRQLFVDLGKSQRQCAETLAKEFGGELTNSAVASQIATLRSKGIIPAGCSPRSTRSMRSRKNLHRVANNLPPPPKVAAAITEPDLPPIIWENGQPANVLTLSGGMCRYPIGDPKSADFAFCGRRAHPAYSYCVDHAKLCYPPEPKRDGKKPKPRAWAA